MHNHNALIELLGDLKDSVEKLNGKADVASIDLADLQEKLDRTTNPKFSLTFDNEADFCLAINGHKYLRVLNQLDMWCRNILKYGQTNDPYVYLDQDDEQAITLLGLREHIRKLMEDEDVSLEDGE